MARSILRSAAGAAARLLIRQVSSRMLRRAVGSGSALALVAGTAIVASASLPPVPVPAENPITEAKRVLGKVLFWDEQLSTSDLVSCGTCHIPARNGSDNRLARTNGLDGVPNNTDDVFGSPGIIKLDANKDYVRDPVFGFSPQITPRAGGSFFLAAHAPEVFHDGRARGTFLDPLTGQVAIASGGALENQSLQPILSTGEMAHSNVDWASIAAKLRRVSPLHLATSLPADVASALASKPSYPQLFTQAFGDPAITPTRIAFALATYERTLVPDQAPVDKYELGIPGAMTNQQIQGMGLFNQSASSCSVCHAGRLLTDNTFRNIGIRPPAQDTGRQAVTGDPADRGKFRVPSLRNVGLKRTFMHNGQIQTLTDVVKFYARANGALPQFNDNIDPVMPLITVSTSNTTIIVDFLQNALTDPRVANQTFPFDRPQLATERSTVLPSVLTGGTAGTGGLIPRIFVQSPAFMGNPDFRVGLDQALGGTQARLAISSTPPSAGRILPDYYLTSKVSSGAGPGGGYATEHIAINPQRFYQGQTYYMQWFVTDPSGADGVALSNVLAVPIFCGSYGCTMSCSPADIADGLGNPLPSSDYNPGVDGGDFDCFFNHYFEPAPDNYPCDIADGSGNPLPPFGPIGGFNPGVDGGDFDCFFNYYFSGCP